MIGGNTYAPTLQVIPLTSRCKNELPIHITITGYGLKSKSTLLTEQIQTIDKSTLRRRIGIVDNTVMDKVNVCMMIQLGMFT